MAASKDDFRRAMGQFATGVTIITTRRGDVMKGMTANAFTSVSLEPPLVLVCVDHTSDTHDVLKESGVFAVNILSREQEALSRQFATKAEGTSHLLEGVPYRLGITGAPIITGCLGYLDCRVVSVYPGGDHTIFIGQVEEAQVMEESHPLIFFRSVYHSLGSQGAGQGDG